MKQKVRNEQIFTNNPTKNKSKNNYKCTNLIQTNRE